MKRGKISEADKSAALARIRPVIDNHHERFREQPISPSKPSPSRST